MADWPGIVIEHITDALMITDRSHKTTWLNGHSELLFGTTLEEVRGKSPAEITGIGQLTSLLEDLFEQKVPQGSVFEKVDSAIKPSGRRYFFKVAVSPIEDGASFSGALIQLTDITRFYEMEKFKDDYVSIISHEFRTPLTSIVLGVEMLREGMLGDLNARGVEIFEAIGHDCRRLTKLVDNLLELSRIESGTIYIQAEPVDAADLVREAVRPLQIQAEKKEIALVTDLPSSLPPVAADFNKAVWVLTNLIGNALRYTGSGGSITVKVESGRRRLYFSVRDTGCGIPREYQEQIFQKFIQVRAPA
ncbi:MAG: PAS domain-containing sensor histidine kinase, partial [Firmicutes bacterium]|nr:PAS domain-containing sensor histidine kinase [Bacillota bacterium]